MHFWPLSTLVYGIRIDYLSPATYFLDILIIFYLSLSSRLPSTLSRLHSIFPILLVNLIFSQNPASTLSWSLHLVLYLLFISSLPLSRIRNTLYKILPIAILFQVTLALTQVTIGHSVGGLMYYLGERTVAVGAPTIALAMFMDHVVLRAYGTFGHPNVLAGWLVIALLITIQLWRQRQSSVGLTLKDSSAISVRKDPRRSDPMGTKTIWVPLILTTLGIFLTQSRAAALTLFVFIIPFYLLKSLKSRVIYFVLILASSFYLLSSGTLLRAFDLSSSERLTLQGVSLKAIQAFPLFGTGAQASISTYPTVSPNTRLLQPDHNSLTLFLSWFGIFGLLAILYSLRFQFKNLRIYDFRFVLPLLPLLLLDHYLFTSPQGLFVLLLYPAVAVNYSHAQKNRE